MQNLIIINLKPNTSLTRYDASGWRKASLDGSDAVDGVIVRLLRGGWRLVSADQTSMYFALDVTMPAPTVAAVPSSSSVATLAPPPEPPKKAPIVTQPKENGMSAKRPAASPDIPIYVRPVPELVKEESVPKPAFTRPVPERIDLDEWLR